MADLKNMIEKLKGEITGPGVMSDREMEMFNNAMSPNINDNEPRFDERSLKNRMFTIDSKIRNLMKEYDMNLRNKQFAQAQQIADIIDDLQLQKDKMQTRDSNSGTGVMSDREMEMFNNAMPSRAMPPMSPMAQGGIMAFANGGEAMAPQMSNEQGMAEIEMSKEQAMQEIFIPLAENGYEQEVMAILNNPIDSEISMQAQQVLAQVLSQDPEFDMEDFQMAVSLVAPQ
tara:strand:+ start:2611 stop:3297 length:687 start_codon:yes stop_codon:yes gene_type:complete